MPHDVPKHRLFSLKSICSWRSTYMTYSALEPTTKLIIKSRLYNLIFSGECLGDSIRHMSGIQGQCQQS